MIKIAINQHHKNKMPNLPSHMVRNWWREFNGQFTNFDLPSVDPLVWAITNGYAITAQHSGYRKRDDFVCGQHIGLDFDTGDERSDVGRLCENSFIKEHASFLHTTASHTNRNPRSRVIFILERPIYNRESYSLLTEAFAEAFSTNGGADPSCKDPVRLFFGAEGCDVLRLDNVLTVAVANEIVAPYKEIQKKRQATRYNGESFDVAGDAGWQINRELDKLVSAPDGHKWLTLTKVSRTIGGYVGAGYISEVDASSMLSMAIEDRAEDMSIASNTIEWGLRVGRTQPIYLAEDTDPVIRCMLS